MKTQTIANLGVALLLVSTGALAATPTAASTSATTPAANAIAPAVAPPPATGFRAARFGDTEAQVIAAIAKDFNVKLDAIKQQQDPAARTAVLSVPLPDLAPLKVPATVHYVLGYKCKCLTQVNVEWRLDEKLAPEKRSVALDGIRGLSGYFARQRWDETVVEKLGNDAGEGQNGVLIFFRGVVRQGGSTTLIGAPVKLSKAAAGGNLVADVDTMQTVTLYYEQSAANPDIFRVDVTGF